MYAKHGAANLPDKRGGLHEKRDSPVTFSPRLPRYPSGSLGRNTGNRPRSSSPGNNTLRVSLDASLTEPRGPPRVGRGSVHDAAARARCATRGRTVKPASRSRREALTRADIRSTSCTHELRSHQAHGSIRKGPPRSTVA